MRRGGHRSNWGLHPPLVTTASVAPSRSNAINGGLRVITGRHRENYLPQINTYDAVTALTCGQKITAEVDEAQAVDLALEPGQMSLHHIG